MSSSASLPSRQRQLMFVMAQVNKQWRRTLDKVLAPLGLTQALWLPLVHLERSAGAMRQKDLALALALDSSSIVRLIDGLQAQGKNSAQIARDIEKELAKYVRDPVVTVIVTNFVGPYSEQIRVVGEAAKPQFLPYKQKMTVLDVMIAVGGLTDFADGNSATLVRAAEDNKRYKVRLHDLIKRGDIDANVEVLPGDVLIIPQGWF